MTSSNNQENSARIAKNTLLLYGRMAITMWISLYTSRLVLSVLGVEDFGIYNVVGGVTAIMWSFIGALSSATTRHITFELGRKDIDKLTNVFKASLSLHSFLAFMIILLSETLGLWFISNELVIPADRLNAALWVFHFSVFSLVVSVLSVPFNACIVAHENMSAYAYISIIDTILKLVVILIIKIMPFDKLVLYAFFCLFTQFIMQGIYMLYCVRSFPEVKLGFSRDKVIIRDMSIFAFWNLIGCGGALVMQQGHSIILNQFFGPVVNAAKGVAGQVLGMISKFTSNFQIAVNPQLFKSYASDNLAYMHKLIFNSSRYSFYLFLLIAVPVYIEVPFLLELWLEEVPDNTISFLRVSLLTAATNILASPLVTSAQATGKIRNFQIVESVLLLLILPFSWYVLWLGKEPVYAFYIYFLFHAIAVLARVYLLRKMIHLSSILYIKKVIFVIVIVSSLSIFFGLLVSQLLPNIFIYRLISLGASFILTVLVILCIGVSTDERTILKDKLRAILIKLKNRII